MCNARYNGHTDPLFKENKILKIRDIFKLNCLKLYHKYTNQEVPNFFNNMFTTNADIHSYHTRRRNDLQCFSHNTEGANKQKLDTQFPMSLMNWQQLLFVKSWVHQS